MYGTPIQMTIQGKAEQQTARGGLMTLISLFILMVCVSAKIGDIFADETNDS